MKGKLSILLLLLLAVPPSVSVAERLIPAGSLISCTVSEPRLSSRTANIGDPDGYNIEIAYKPWLYK